MGFFLLLNSVIIWKEGNVLFKNAFNTLYLWLYCVEHIAKNHLDNERENLLPHFIGYSF